MTSSACGPIAYFAFNRPVHTARSLAALAANPEAGDTDLHAFVDGPRREDDRPFVAEVLAVIRAAKGFRSVTVHQSQTNQGLYRAVTSGVSHVLTTADRVIVVEDDILASPYFLAYMNDGLKRYESVQQVGSIHAYSPPIDGLPDYFFLRGGDCWGWATWADRWQLFQSDPSALLKQLVSSDQVLAFCTSHGIGSLLLLIRRARRRNQSWAILWHASLFLAGRLTLHPGRAFADNIGNDGSGEHSSATDSYATRLVDIYQGLPGDLPVREDASAAHALRAFLESSAFGRSGALRRRLLSAYAMLSVRVLVRR